MDNSRSYLGHLLDSYSVKKDVINSRLLEFEKVGEEGDERIFSELCFCILTPQSKARVCDVAIKGLVKTGVLFNGTFDEIRAFLVGVRFPNNKARFLIGARNFFTSERGLRIKDKIGEFVDPLLLREWLVANVKGLGYKEASHFLRNIGLGSDLAILDRHILKNLHLLGVIDDERVDGKKRYLEIEKRMLRFSKDINISLGELDLLLWSEETGEIFK